jgi:hypothetical protein
MFDDVDRTVEELLRQGLPLELLEHVGISFATPDSEFPPGAVTLPAINIFLYDVRENMDLRNREWYVERQDDGSSTRQRAPVRVDCSYLVTAWPSEAAPNPAEDEHRLLGEVLKVLLRHATIPQVLLQGSLKAQEPPLPAVTIHASQLQSWGDFWQAIGAKPKVALNYTVTIGVVPDRAIETEVPVRDKTLKFQPVMEVTCG